MQNRRKIMMRKLLREKIINKEAKVSVIGLGYVGLPLIVAIAKSGYNAIGLDVSRRKIDLLNKGISYVQDVESKDIKELIECGKLECSDDMSKLKEVDAVSICVPTPLNKSRDPDMSYVMSAINELSKYIHAGMLIILESTTYPGTTRELLLPALSKNLEVGKDFFLAFSPERIDPGNKQYSLYNTPKVVGGVTPYCTELAKLLYEQFIQVVHPVSSPEAAEMVKLLENTFRAVNIGLVNEVAIMCNKLNIDTWEVIEAAATKPFGFMRFDPGPGLGGHCIPIDPLYLSWKLKTINYTARFIELASEVNSHMPEFVLSKISDALNERRRSLKGASVLIIGVAYKKDIDDLRESPALDLMRLLISKGASIDYYDPYVEEVNLDGNKFYSINLSDLKQNNYDLAVIVTNHSCFDYQLFADKFSLIIDCRNAMKNVKGKAHIIKL
jgi:UDP-N-acetyl-D-glucosamine dehydrogenase